MLTKRMLFIVLVTTLLVLSTSSAFAHELFLKANEDIEVGQETTIRIYWGHFPDNLESTGYFDGLLNGRFYLVAPDGTETDLTLVAEEDHYTATFTPRQAGDHWAVFSHNRGVLDWIHSEPQGNQLVTVHAKILLDVHGDDETVAFSRLMGHDLEILPLVDGGHIHVSETYRAQLLYFGRPLVNANIFFYGPDDIMGETVTGEGGTFSFPLTVEGDWLIKISYVDSSRTGQEGGLAYAGARYTTTLLISPHAHDEGEAQLATTPDPATNYGYIPMVIAMMLGAGFFYLKPKKA